jgi:flagellar biosynthesis protein FlhF
MNANTASLDLIKPGIQRGKKYRFTVKSAEEAIQVIRERLGESAKVLSVKQVDGQGLRRFLSSPQLEIIATIPDFEELPKNEPVKPTEHKKPSLAAAEPQFTNRDEVMDALREVQDSVEAPAPVVQKNERPKRIIQQSIPADNIPAGGATVWDALRRASFSESLITSIRYGLTDGRKLEDLPLSVALSEVRKRLRKAFYDMAHVPVTERIAFMGTPGVGKTTAVCKRLAQEVFIKRRGIQVIKLETETPNPDDGLSVFCEVLGVPLLRDPMESGLLETDDTLYFDLPGICLNANGEAMALKQRLDQLSVATRVLVINAAYETELIEEAFDMGCRMGATHLVLTHLDEIKHVSKLWPFILKSGLTPLFVSHGQNVTSDYDEDMEQYLASRTFPNRVVN